MQYHKLTEHFDEKPFSCEECGAKFAANSTLKNHLRLHTGDRPFMCKHCLMTFTQASALAYHTKKKHSEGKGGAQFISPADFTINCLNPIWIRCDIDLKNKTI